MKTIYLSLSLFLWVTSLNAEVFEFNCGGIFSISNNVPDLQGNFEPFRSNVLGSHFPAYKFDNQSLELQRITYYGSEVKSTDSLQRVKELWDERSDNESLLYVSEDLKVTVTLNVVGKKPSSMMTVVVSGGAQEPYFESCSVKTN